MVVPTPGVLATSMNPSCSLTTPWTMASPRPDPEVSPARFLVKNGSKTCPSSCGSMPQPSSETDSVA